MINFPDTPTLAQIFTTAGSSWQWDGNKWEGATVAGGGPYLLLTGGTLTGQLTVNPNIVIGNPVTSPPATSLVINKAASTPQPATYTGPQAWFASETNSSVLVDAYGSTPYFLGRMSRGTAASPAPVQTGDYLTAFSGQGRATSVYGSGGFVGFAAAENWTNTAQGTQTIIACNAVGSTIQTIRVRVAQGVVIGNNAGDPGQGGLVLNANAAAPQPTTLSQPLLWLAQADGVQGNILNDAYGGITANFVGRLAGGTAAAPTALGGGAVILSLTAQGRGATSYGFAGSVSVRTAEAWSDTAHGSFIRFDTISPTTTTAAAKAWIVDGVVVPGSGGAPPAGGLSGFGDMGPGTINVASGYYVNGGGATGVALLASGNSYINSGNVGIGTAGPSGKLHVVNNDSNLILDTPAANQTASISFRDGGNARWGLFTSASASHDFGLYNSTTASVSLTVQSSSGNVGIGTSAPSEALQIHGNIRVDRSDISFIPFVIGTDGNGMFFTEYSGTTPQHTPLYLAAGGHVGIGTVTPGTMLTVVAPPGGGDPVNVVADSNREARILFSATSTRQWAAGCDGQYYSGGFVIADNTAAATRLLINTAGACFNTTGTWATLSDASVKENVTPYTRGLEAIVALNPVQFRYAAGTPFAEANKPSRQLFGLIADEVKPHVPEIVGTTKATIGKKEGVELSTLEPGNLIYAIINAIKELNAKVVAMSPPPARRKAA